MNKHLILNSKNKYVHMAAFCKTTGHRFMPADVVIHYLINEKYKLMINNEGTIGIVEIPQNTPDFGMEIHLRSFLKELKRRKLYKV